MLGCGGASSTGSTTTESTAPTETTVASASAAWEGLWQTNFGPVGLVAVEGEPNLVGGAYEYQSEGRTIRGSLVGQVQGNTLDVAWEDEPGGLGTGHARFTLSADGNSWTGTWGRGDSDSDGGEWSGQLNSR
jgi:hypothetical protein